MGRLKPHALAMRCFLLVGLALGSPAPQYSGSKSELTVSELGTIEDIFGSSGTYSSTGKQTSQLNGNKVIVQVVTNEAGYVAPDDYRPSQGAFTNSQQLNEHQGGNEYYGGSLVDVSAFGRRTEEEKPPRDSSAVRLTASTSY